MDLFSSLKQKTSYLVTLIHMGVVEQVGERATQFANSIDSFLKQAQSMLLMHIVLVVLLLLLFYYHFYRIDVDRHCHNLAFTRFIYLKNTAFIKSAFSHAMYVCLIRREEFFSSSINTVYVWKKSTIFITYCWPEHFLFPRLLLLSELWIVFVFLLCYCVVAGVLYDR